MPPPSVSPGPKNVVQVAQSVTDLSSLVDALTKAELVDDLSAAGTFTVFAPTNSAFQALDADTLAALLEPAGKADLANILKYHVLATQVLSTDLAASQTVATLQGKDLTVTKVDGTVKVNDVATVTMADQMASNGVAHIIDAVLMPPKVSSPAPDGAAETQSTTLVDAAILPSTSMATNNSNASQDVGGAFSVLPGAAWVVTMIFFFMKYFQLRRFSLYRFSGPPRL